jgi:putative tryptophan/tyrosine transport system substrate-binding protein
MKRREFITLLGGAAAAAWPLAARAQQPKMPEVGFLSLASAGQNAPFTESFVRGLSETGFTEGRNVAIEYRWADGQYDQLPALAAELVRRNVAVVFASGGTPPLRAAMAATRTIPIIFSLGDDPVKQGIVSSINRPNGNVTGVTFATTSLGAKRLEFMRELVPKAGLIAVLVNPNSAGSTAEQQQLESMAATTGLQIVFLHAENVTDIDAAFADLAHRQAGALLVAPDAFFQERRDQIVALAAYYSVPAIYIERVFVAAGGLMSYGASLRDSYHQAGVYAGRILGGAKPADLPVVMATRFELVLNLKAAKALGLIVQDKMLALADEVIE